MDWEKLIKKTVDVGKNVAGGILDEITGAPKKFKFDIYKNRKGFYEIWISGKMPLFDGDTFLEITAYDKYSKDKYPNENSEKSPSYIYSILDEWNDEQGKWGNKLPIKDDLGGMEIKLIKVHTFIPEILVAKYSGDRTITFQLCWQRKDGKFYTNDNYKHDHVIYMPNGEQDQLENLAEIKKLFIKIGLAVAFADGSIDKQESQIVKEYGAMLAGSDLKLKENLNLIIKETYAKYKKLSFDNINSEIATLAIKFNEIADTAQKYKLADFCYSLMAADKKADKNELKILDKLKGLLDIEDEYFEKLSDQKIVELDSSSVESNLEKILGIDTSWSKEKISKHLATEFQKWSNRLNTLTDEEKKQKAQGMLELIAKARIKYEI